MTDHHRITIGANEATAKQVVYLLPSRDDDAAHPGLAGLVEELEEYGLYFKRVFHTTNL